MNNIIAGLLTVIVVILFVRMVILVIEEHKQVNREIDELMDTIAMRHHERWKFIRRLEKKWDIPSEHIEVWDKFCHQPIQGGYGDTPCEYDCEDCPSCRFMEPILYPYRLDDEEENR